MTPSEKLLRAAILNALDPWIISSCSFCKAERELFLTDNATVLEIRPFVNTICINVRR